MKIETVHMKKNKEKVSKMSDRDIGRIQVVIRATLCEKFHLVCSQPANSNNDVVMAANKGCFTAVLDYFLSLWPNEIPSPQWANYWLSEDRLENLVERELRLIVPTVR